MTRKEAKKRTRRNKSCRTHWTQLSSVKSRMSSGLMWLDLIKLRPHFRRLSYSLLSSPSYLQVKGNLGEESYSTDPQARVSPTWQRHVRLRLIAPSSLSVLQIWSANGWESPKSSSSNFSSSLEKTSLLLSLSTKLIHYAAVVVRVKMRHLAESRLSSLCKCKVLEMTTTESLSWVHQTFLGSSTPQSDVVSRSVFISPFQNPTPE